MTPDPAAFVNKHNGGEKEMLIALKLERRREKWKKQDLHHLAQKLFKKRNLEDRCYLKGSSAKKLLLLLEMFKNPYYRNVLSNIGSLRLYTAQH